MDFDEVLFEGRPVFERIVAGGVILLSLVGSFFIYKQKKQLKEDDQQQKVYKELPRSRRILSKFPDLTRTDDDDDYDEEEEQVDDDMKSLNAGVGMLGMSRGGFPF